MIPLAATTTPAGEPLPLSLKASLAAGPVRRFLVGDPHLDLLTGTTLERVARAEEVAQQGETVVGPEIARPLGDQMEIAAWREGLALVAGLAEVVPPAPWSALPPEALTAEQLRPFLLPPVYQRLTAGQGEFLAELRPAVALFLRFEGIDYDSDGAGPTYDHLAKGLGVSRRTIERDMAALRKQGLSPPSP